MIEVKKIDDGYVFKRIDDDGGKWFLGTAEEVVQNPGRPDEMRWYKGYLDTRRVVFENEEELRQILRRRKPNDEVLFM